MKNCDLIVGKLEKAGVRWVFGVPSGPVLPLIESLRRSSIEFILTASETSAGFMASVIGYLTGRPGVCISTVGPGATNLTTGVGCAWLDRAPVLAITCNVPSAWLERRIQMRIDHQALFKPITKRTFPFTDGKVSEILAQALTIAIDEPPGPVHLDLPEDVALASGAEEWNQPGEAKLLADCSEAIAQALSQALNKSQRPLLVTGLTFARHNISDQLVQFIERQKIPFVSTLHGKGFLPESHSNWAGVIGRARRTDIKRFIDQADLIIAVGYDPIEMNYEEWVGQTPVVHISTEAAEDDGSIAFAWNQACNLNAAVAAMAKIPAVSNMWSVEDWRDHRMSFDRALRPPSSQFAAHQVLDILREKLAPNGILAYDVGAHTHQIASQWRTDCPKSLLATNGWSSMGYGMPAAYAAKLVFPARQVVAVVGDGGFQMTAGELSLARRLRLQVPVIVLNDGWLGLMKVKQERKHYHLSGVHLGSPPESPAHYFGVPCRPAKTPDEFSQALQWAFTLESPSVIEAFIDVEPYSQTVFD
jgi:acetolactate synthase I/II/III large subunit